MSRYEPTRRILAVTAPAVTFGNDEVTLDMTPEPLAASELVTDFDDAPDTTVDRYPRSMAIMSCPDRAHDVIACFCGECEDESPALEGQDGDDYALELADRAEAERG